MEHAPDRPPDPWDDAALLAHLRAGDEAALIQLFVRYAPLLRDALRPHQVPPEDQEAFVLDLLTDVALACRDGRHGNQRSLRALLLTMLHRRVVDRHRRVARRRALLETMDPELLAVADVAEELHDLADADEAAPAEPMAAASAAQATVALLALAQHLDRHLDDDDRQVLVALGERVPQRVIASWFGVSAGAMRMRIARLRERLRMVARTFLASLDDAAHAELARFFRRVEAPGGSPPTPTTPSAVPTRRPGGRRHGASS